MSPEEAVAQRILQLPAVTAIVDDRVFVLMARQSAPTPWVLVQQISQIDEGAHDRGAGGVGWARVQVDAVTDITDGGNGYRTARILTDAIHGDGRGDDATGLLGWRGEIAATATTSPGDLTITGIFSMLDAVAEFTPDELTQIRMRRDYQVWFSQEL